MPFGLFSPKVGHQALYNDLCKVHGLDRKTRALLDQMVLVLDIRQPALVFVDTSWFRKALTHSDFTSQEELIRELCYKWFGRRI